MWDGAKECVCACVLVRARLCMCVLYWARGGGGGLVFLFQVSSAPELHLESVKRFKSRDRRF